MKRKMFAVILVLLLALSLTACKPKTSVGIEVGAVAPGKTLDEVEVSMTVGETFFTDFSVQWYEVYGDEKQPIGGENIAAGDKDYVLEITYSIQSVVASGELKVNLGTSCTYAEIQETHDAEGQACTFVTSILFSKAQYPASVVTLVMDDIRMFQPLRNFYDCINILLDGKSIGYTGLEITCDNDSSLDFFMSGMTYSIAITYRLPYKSQAITYETTADISPLPLSPIEREDGSETISFSYTVPAGTAMMDEGDSIHVNFSAALVPYAGMSIEEYMDTYMMEVNGESPSIFAEGFYVVDENNESSEFDGSTFENGSCYMHEIVISIPGYGPIEVESEQHVEVERVDKYHGVVRAYYDFMDPIIIDVTGTAPTAGMSIESFHCGLMVDGKPANVFAGAIYEVSEENYDFTVFEEGKTYCWSSAISVPGWGQLEKGDYLNGADVQLKRVLYNRAGVDVYFEITGDAMLNVYTMVPQAGTDVKYYTQAGVVLNFFNEPIRAEVEWNMPAGETVFKAGETYNVTVSFDIFDQAIDQINAGCTVYPYEGFVVDNLEAAGNTVTVKMHATALEYPETNGHVHDAVGVDAGASSLAECAAHRFEVAVCSCGAYMITDLGAGNGAHEAEGYDAINSVFATCTTQGIMYYTCGVCGASYSETIGPWEHTYELVESKAATCTTEGYDLYACSMDCGTTYKDVYPALGHDYIVVSTEAATCSHGTITTYTCLHQCGSTYTEEANDRLQHNLVVETSRGSAATCTSNGVEYRHCTNAGCSYTEQSTIPALGHNMVDDPDSSTPPTCTQQGTNGQICTRCFYTTSTSVAALGHDLVYERAATYAANEHQYHCTRCQYSGTESCTYNNHSKCILCGGDEIIF